MGKQAIPGNLPEAFRVDRKTAIIRRSLQPFGSRARVKCLPKNYYFTPHGACDFII